MADTTYDVVIIGAGPGGYVAAIRAAQLGLTVAVVERDQVGGVCLNWGCIPTKALLRSGEVLSLFRRAEEFGISLDNLRFDYGKAVARSRTIVRRLTRGVELLLKKNGVERFQGHARLRDAHTVEVGEGSETLSAGSIIIATGARPRALPGLEADGEAILNSREALELTEVPSPVAIVGGGPIGVEFAYLYRSYGAEVILVELLPRLVPGEDEEISQQLERAFSRQGIRVLTGSRVKRVEKSPSGVKLAVESPEGGLEIECQRVLVAAGIEGNTEGLGLDDLGVERERGSIVVDGAMRTNVPNVYAIGDVTGLLPLAHVASAQGVLAAETIAGIASKALNYTYMPRAIYCQPQIASFGYTEAEAKKGGLSIKVGRFPFRANGKALAIGEGDGFVKVVVDGESDRIVGAHMIGPEVTEILPELTMSNLMEGTARELGWLVHSHPSLSEAVREAALAAEGQAIHI